MSHDQQIAASIEKGHCPDCGGRGFVIGPMGGATVNGAAINIECANVACRNRFNVGTFSGHVVMAHRIDNTGSWPSEPDGSEPEAEEGDAISAPRVRDIFFRRKPS